MAPGAAESHIKEYIKTEKESATEREAGSSDVWTAWFLKGSAMCAWAPSCLIVRRLFFLKTEENRKCSHTESKGAVYLPCFGLVLDSLFGLFLSYCNVVHWFGYILLYVVYYITLEKKQQWSKTAQINSRNTALQFELRAAQVLNETNIHGEKHSVFPWRDANNNTDSRTTPLPQTGLSLRKHGASSNKHVVRLREDGQSSVHVCVGCNVKWALVSAVMPYSYSLLKPTQLDSTHPEWWDGRRDGKETLRKKWSWKRADRHKCGFVVRGEERIQ